MTLRFEIIIETKSDAITHDAGHDTLAAIIARQLGAALALPWIIDYEIREVARPTNLR